MILQQVSASRRIFLSGGDNGKQQNGLPCDGMFEGRILCVSRRSGAALQTCLIPQIEMKNVLMMAYILEGAKRVFNIPSYKIKITHDGEVIEDEFIFGMVTNSRSVGGFKGIIGPEIVFDDGVFEVTLIKTPKNAIELNELLGAIVMKQLDSKRMYSFKTGEIKFESEEEIPWTLDGEFGGAHKEITVKDKKQAVQIKVDSEVAAGLSVDSEKVKK